MGNAPYDAIADWYDSLVRSGGFTHDVVLPSVYMLIGSVQKQWVCDLACGQGVVSRELTRQGANVVGMDISIKLLELARNYRNDEVKPILYIQGDAQSLAIQDAAFDGVVCNMALMDIPDLRAVLFTVARILKPQGWFVFSVTHPCLETIKGQPRWTRSETGDRAVMSYFDETAWRSDNPDGIRNKVDAHHRTLSTYVNTLKEANLIIERLVEPQATGEIADRYSTYDAIPSSLVVRCRKLLSEVALG